MIFLSKNRFLFLLGILLLVVLDQITKRHIANTFSLGESREVVSGLFNLTLVHNYGAAFGMFGGIENNTTRLSLLWGSSMLALAVLVMVYRSERENRKALIGLLLIIAGAIGNLIDRGMLGYVVDFFDFYFGEHHWPAFNLADSYICIGVGMLFLFTGRKTSTVHSSVL